MKINPVQAAPIQQSPVQGTATAGASGSMDYIGKSPTPCPTQSHTSPAADPARVPKGQLERTRDKIPQGWSNDGGHNGFKPAVISQVAEGYHIAAINRSDVPRGRR